MFDFNLDGKCEHLMYFDVYLRVIDVFPIQKFLLRQPQLVHKKVPKAMKFIKANLPGAMILIGCYIGFSSMFCCRVESLCRKSNQ